MVVLQFAPESPPHPPPPPGSLLQVLSTVWAESDVLMRDRGALQIWGCGSRERAARLAQLCFTVFHRTDFCLWWSSVAHFVSISLIPVLISILVFLGGYAGILVLNW